MSDAVQKEVDAQIIRYYQRVLSDLVVACMQGVPPKPVLDAARRALPGRCPGTFVKEKERK